MHRLTAALTLAALTMSTAAMAQTPSKFSTKKWCDSDVAELLAAAEKGDPDAMLCMGVKHSNKGTQVPKDDVEATRWFIRAADAGQPTGMFMAGVAFWSGRGIAQDMVEAYKWLDLSVRFNNEKNRHPALTAREGLTRVLSRQQITEAKKREADWEKEFQKRKKSQAAGRSAD